MIEEYSHPLYEKRDLIIYNTTKKWDVQYDRVQIDIKSLHELYLNNYINFDKPHNRLIGKNIHKYSEFLESSIVKIKVINPNNIKSNPIKILSISAKLKDVPEKYELLYSIYDLGPYAQSYKMSNNSFEIHFTS